MDTRNVVLAVVVLLAGFGGTALAQPVGTFRWQLQPFCNVVTVAITQNGAVYRLEGTDDQCGGGADAASVAGAFPNADGTIGFGLNIVTAPGGRPVHVEAEISLGTFSGTWRGGVPVALAFVLTPGAGNGGAARPLPSGVPSTIVLRPDGGFLAGGVLGVGQVQPWVRRAHDVSTGQSGVPAARPSVRRGMTLPSGAPAPPSVSATAGRGASMATGMDTVATGQTSAAMGNATRASGFASTALGESSDASGRGSLAGGVAAGRW